MSFNIQKALCIDGSRGIINDTSGIIFLGTPHQGSSVSIAAAVLAFVTGFLGSDTTLLMSLRRDEPQLSDLADRFGECIAEKKRRHQNIEIINFFETMPTYLLGCLSIGLVSLHALEPAAVLMLQGRFTELSFASGLQKYEY